MSDPLSSVLQVEDRGPVRILRMNRPEKLNALNTDLTVALEAELDRADMEDDIRAVVLCGSGRAFCAGADISEFSELTPDRNDLVLERSELTMRVHMKLQTLSKPIVSAVQGAAVGGGAGLAIGCDMMIAADDLKFGYPEIRRSVVPAIVMTGLQRQIGRKTAFEMISTGKLLDAEQVFALGLANRIVPLDALLATALEIAQAWSKAHPRAMATTKRLFYGVADLPFAAAMEAGRKANVEMRGFGGNQP